MGMKQRTREEIFMDNKQTLETVIKKLEHARDLLLEVKEDGVIIPRAKFESDNLIRTIQIIRQLKSVFDNEEGE